MDISLKSVDLNHFPQLPLQAAEFNKCVDAEIDRRSRLLLTQHPRPSPISAHDRRYRKKSIN